MSKFKITIIDQNTGIIASEILESPVFPFVSFPQYSISTGQYGIPVKIELILDADENDTHDTTTAL